MEKQGKVGGRQGFLKELAKLDGIYVPSLYEVHYNEDNTFKEILPLCPEAKPVINKRVIKKFPRLFRYQKTCITLY